MSWPAEWTLAGFYKIYRLAFTEHEKTRQHAFAAGVHSALTFVASKYPPVTRHMIAAPDGGTVHMLVETYMVLFSMGEEEARAKVQAHLPHLLIDAIHTEHEFRGGLQ